MAQTITIDELLHTIRIPQRLPAKEHRAIRRTLIGARTWAVLEHALQEVIRRFPSLRKTRLTLTR